MLKRFPYFFFAAGVLFALGGCAASQETAVVTERPDPPVAEPAAPLSPEVADEFADVTPGRFDTGKMWTFDNPPLDYFEEAYGFRPDSQWFAKARLGALRIPGCSASFVSSMGLVLTNHHCARSSITEVSKPGEKLLDVGFYADSLGGERRVPELYAEQLIRIRDVTEDVYRGLADAEAQPERRQHRAEALQERLIAEVKEQDTTLTVQVIELYHGGQYSAYTFRRYGDVRLVMAPEVKIGGFGGDPDNFTYPRYSLDYSFFRVYDVQGRPLQTENFFPWSTTGTREGEAVFVLGNPGTTSRLNTVSQLRFERDHSVPQQLEVLRARAEILRGYLEAHPDEDDEGDLRNTQHAIENQVKKLAGELSGLRDPYLIARREAAEQELRREIARDTLQERYGDVFNRIATLQRSKEATADQAGAFTYFGAPIVDSHVLIRALYGYIHGILRQRGAPQSRLEEVLEEAFTIEDWPAEVETQFLAARLRELQASLGETDPTVLRVLQGRTPEAVAERVISGTALVDSARFAAILEEGYLDSGDPTVSLIEAVAPLFFSLSQQIGGFTTTEEALNAQLARARFAIHGTRIPPDATFSLRIADGVVRGYPYNGTIAPAYTTLFGMYDHYASYREVSDEWDLPERWLGPPAGLDLRAPVNLVSTNDITGGNSGSPLINRNLELVGLIFDSNIEALPHTYLYLEDAGRAISVDARGILETLRNVYNADRIVVELTTGQAR